MRIKRSGAAGWSVWLTRLGPLLALGALLAVAAGMGLGPFARSQGLTFTNTPLVSFGSPSESAPAPLPAFVNLPVPFTSQAPKGEWSASQHDCEEASLAMVDRYLRGDRSGGLIDPDAAEAAIRGMTPWKVSQDLVPSQLGLMAREHLGWSYRIYAATPANIKQQIALGRPVIVGVLTHGLGNPAYPGYRDHYEQPDWSVSHFVVVTGYDASSAILNDPGINQGHGYHISFSQLFYAITDLDRAYPNLDAGLVVLVLAPGVA